MTSCIRLLPAFLFLFIGWVASAETCMLKTYASSWMVTGTPFTVECPSGSYTGHLVSTPARRFFRRGHLMLVFDQPVTLAPKKEGDEGKIQVGHGRQIVNILTTGGTGIGAKDVTDGLSGAVFKSWYMIPASCAALAFFSNGGDVLLKPGHKLEIVSLNRPATPSAEGLMKPAQPAAP
ncbi:MAG TPA: hypothetical protein VMU71_08825 [Terracidiphilus sp.]|nr:hypothetical protein [Terracidiphilus sp.]